MRSQHLRTGRVKSFDDDRGLGVILDDGDAEWPFHCTQIADGTRTIDENISVRFQVRAGLMGRWEATAVTPA